MSAHAHAKPIGGKMLDPLMMTCLGLFGLAVVVMGYRFVTGIGPVSAMTDGYAWGIWEPVNVVVFTGIGAGAYSVGLLCYLLNKGEYHPLVRPAVLLGAIAYSLGGSSILIALGRYWNAYWLFNPFIWNLGSVLLEVAVCVMTYVSVLWVEVLPSVLDGARDSSSPRWSAFGKKWGPKLAAAMPYIIALAMILPTMHQSSLGGLMLIAVAKIHPLWHTSLLPLLGLISCLSMGYGAVVVLTNLLKIKWNAERDQKVLAGLSKVNAYLLLAYAVIRVLDIVVKGRIGYLFAFGDWHLYFFLLEMALFIVPAVMFLKPEVQASAAKTFSAAMMSIWAGALWRVDAYLTAYNPGNGWEYFPSLGELIVTVGMAGIGVAVFLFIARTFPVVVLAEKPAAGAVARAAVAAPASNH